MNLKDILYIAHFGKENTSFLEALAQACDIYQMHYPRFIFPNEKGQNFSGKNSRLCYFFAMKPGMHLFLKNLIEKGIFPSDMNSGLIYIRAYYYRAAIFHMLLCDQEKVQSWLEKMEHDLTGYYPTGIPALKVFIKDTRKMVEKFMVK